MLPGLVSLPLLLSPDYCLFLQSPSLSPSPSEKNPEGKQLECSLGVLLLFNFRLRKKEKKRKKNWIVAPAHGDASLDDVQLCCWHEFIQLLLTTPPFFKLLDLQSPGK